MCGICGLIHNDPLQPIDLQVLKRMTNIMQHRGPDGEGFFKGPGAGLGFRRLSIIDLASGSQPLSNETGTLHLICNGEIYNYIELRKALIGKGHIFRSKSDAEVIIHLYEEHGTECLHHLRGMFAFALWDAGKRQLFLARDRLGIKPLHYAIGKDKTLYFASEQKSILTAGRILRDINAQALEDLFTFGFILSPKTLFQGIHVLSPGHFLLYKKGNISIKQYWDLSFPLKHQRLKYSENTWAEILCEKIKEVVSLHMRSDVPVGAWLSAGIDSSALVSLINNLTDKPVHTFSLTFGDHPSYDEVRCQNTLDQFPGYDLPNERIAVAQHHFDQFAKGLWHLEDPTASSNHIIRMILAKATSRHYKVVQTGEGADEIFGGYPWYLFNKLCRPFAVLPRSIRRLMLQLSGSLKKRPWSSRVFMAPYPMDLNRYAELIDSFGHGNITDRVCSDQWRTAIASQPNEYAEFTALNQFEDRNDFEIMQYMETKTRLADYNVRGLDRASMAHSLEARVPFLDHELVELCTQIPPSLKMKRMKEKYIFRKAMAPHLPPEIANRKKRGLLAPSRPWLKENMPEYIKYFYSEPQLRKKGYFNPAFVRQMLNQHRAGKNNFSRALMAVLNVQVWDELFVQGCKP